MNRGLTRNKNRADETACFGRRCARIIHSIRTGRLRDCALSWNSISIAQSYPSCFDHSNPEEGARSIARNMVVAERVLGGPVSLSWVRCLGCRSLIQRGKAAHASRAGLHLNPMFQSYCTEAFWRPVVLRGRRSSGRPCHIFNYIGRDSECPTLRFRSYMTERYDEVNGALFDNSPDIILREKLEEEKIFLKDIHPGELRCICPQCTGGSTKEISLAVCVSRDWKDAVWLCHRATCGWKGKARVSKDPTFTSMMSRSKEERKATGNEAKVATLVKEFAEESLGLLPLSSEVKVYLSVRGITDDTLDRNGVKEVIRDDVSVIAFPYWKDGKIVNCKYRDTKENIWQEKNAQKVFYGIDNIKDAEQIIIVEDEIDKLSMEEAGFFNCISVPDAAPAKVSKEWPCSGTEDKTYEYIWNCRGHFEKATRIILATDFDESGQALAEELARRLGRERCWRINWPTYNDGRRCKAANEVLLVFGKQVLRDMVTNAELYPIRGLFRFCDFYKEIDDYYYLRLGDELGVSTGWHGLDELYRVVPGELTLVTGVPNSGKSEWIDGLLCNLNHSKGWTFALCSMENKVREHGRKLLEKHLKKPFFDAPYSNSVPRMTHEDFEAGKQWLDQTFCLIRCDDDELPSIKWVLDLAKSAVMRCGIRGLVIDPYNELDHQRLRNQTETEYVSQMLTKIKRFAQHHDCHVWFVAHPRQLQGWQGDAPNLYDISGSAHFVNKCDNGLVIHRNRDLHRGPIDQVQVFVRKVRNKAAGTIGDAFLSYDRVTGEFTDYKY